VESESVGFEAQIAHLFLSIMFCLHEGYRFPALILIYSAIDTLAWLDRDESHVDVQRSDFIRWVENYLLPNWQSSVTAVDLYAARCSLLHSYSPESKLTREGRADRIYYEWKSFPAEVVQLLLDLRGIQSAKIVCVEDFLYALRTGVGHFLAKVRHDPEKRELIGRRAKDFYLFGAGGIPITDDE